MDEEKKVTALYDLAKMPTTFDFAAWAVIAKTHGANHARFVFEGEIACWKYPDYVAWKRFGNILIPISLLARMTFSVGPRTDGIEVPYMIGDVEKYYKRYGKIRKLKPITEVTESGYVTITIRESFRNRYRNSNVPAWQKFAEYLDKRQIRVVVFPECEQTPIDILHRMKMYAGADMNLGVNCGPLTLCLYSDAPYIMLNMAPKNNTGERSYDMETLLKGCDFWQKQFSFRNDKQLIVWEPDTYENIVSAYEQVTEQKVAA